MKRLLALFLVFACLVLPAGASRNFDGVDDKLEASTAILSATPLTICVWMNADTLGNTTLFSIGSATANGFFSIEIRTAGTLRVKHQDNTFFAVAANSTGTISASSWNHLCGVIASNTSRIGYINGSADGSETATAVGATTVDISVVGAVVEAGAYGGFFDGSISSVAVWNSALTAAEILSASKAFDPCLVKRTGCHLLRIDGNGTEISNRGTSYSTITGTTKTDHPRMFYSF